MKKKVLCSRAKVTSVHFGPISFGLGCDVAKLTVLIKMEAQEPSSNAIILTRTLRTLTSAVKDFLYTDPGVS